MAHYMMVRHAVQDFTKWKVEYDAHESVRQKYGIKEVCLLQNIGDKNDLTILSELSDLAKAMEFLELADLNEAMKKAGILGTPEIFFLKSPQEIS